MADVKGGRHVSYEQIKVMIDFMAQNRDFATGSLRTLEARHTSKKLWGELSGILNDCRLGPLKSADGWSKYWSDFKNKLKNKTRRLKKQKQGLANHKIAKPLSKLEKQAWMILGPHFEKKLSQSDENDKTPNDTTTPEIKQEAYQDNSDFCKTQEFNDRLSDGERDSDDSTQSSFEDNEETDFNSSEPIVHSLYPKWLIEVEKKRADAELLRATAEEKRARASAKSAEAALVQAEALKKLAEAASAQANAIVRIATVLESRGHTDDGLSVSSATSFPGYSI